MSDCNNVRIESGAVRNDLLGWGELGAFVGPAGFAVNDVTVLSEHVASDGTRKLIAGTPQHLFEWDGSAFKFLTPRYFAGTIDSISDDTITGSGTTWDASGIKVGDWIRSGGSNNRDMTLLPNTTWFQITAVTDDTHLEVDHSGNLATGAYTILRIFTATTAEMWSSDMFRDAPSNEDLWIATNGSEIVKWDGSADVVTELSLGFTCKIVRYFKNTMWYANLVISGNTFPGSVRTSALTDPENVSTLEATEIKVSDESPLLALERLSDSMACYSEESVNVVHSVDAPVFWNITTALPDIGIIGERAVVNFGNFHEFLSEDRAYRFDGVSHAEIGRHVMRLAIRGIDPNRLEKAIGFIDTARGEIIWVIPLTSDGVGAGEPPVSAFVEHYDEVSGSNPVPYTKRDLPAVSMGESVDSATSTFDELGDGFNEYETTFANFSSATPLLLFGSDDARVYTLNTKSTGLLASSKFPLTSVARFARRPVIDGDRAGRVIRIEPVTPKIETAILYNLEVDVYTSDHEDGDSSLVASGEFDLTHATRRHVSVGKPGRHVEVEFKTGVGNPNKRPFSLSSFAIIVSPLGRR